MLKELTLASLGETRLAELFEESMGTIRESLANDSDVQGARTLTIKLSFTPNERGYVDSDMTVAASTPNRKVKSMAAFEEGKLKIDTVSDDASQPDMFDEDNQGSDKVTPIGKAAEGGISQ